MRWKGGCCSLAESNERLRVAALTAGQALIVTQLSGRLQGAVDCGSGAQALTVAQLSGRLQGAVDCGSGAADCVRGQLQGDRWGSGRGAYGARGVCACSSWWRGSAGQ